MTDGNTDTSKEAVDPRCAKCGHPRNDHPYRHPFVGPTRDETIAALAAKLTEVEHERDEAMGEALVLAVTLHRKHYNDVPQWEPLNTPAGVISQIDNMVAGIIDRAEAAQANLAKVEAERDVYKEGDANFWTVLDRAEAAEAQLPRAYRMGVEDGYDAVISWEHCYEAVAIAAEIRSIPTPTLAELQARLKEQDDE